MPDSKPAAAENTLIAPSEPKEQADETGPEVLQQATQLPDNFNVFPLLEAPYIPAGDLDVRPSPETPVIVPFPEAVLLTNKVSGVLVLYISADGKVDRVEVDDSDLPPAFEKAAISTFLQARMWPGIMNGQATRARMKVLVEFEQQ